MNEALPLLVGGCLGTAAFLGGGAARRVATGIGGLLLVALSSVLVSGEYRESWAFLLLDGAEEAAAFIAGALGATLARRHWKAVAPKTR